MYLCLKSSHKVVFFLDSHLGNKIHNPLRIVLMEDDFCVIHAKIRLMQILLHGEANCCHTVAATKEFFDKWS